MKEIKYVITDNEGIHARPAGLLVKECSKYASEITIKKGANSGNAKRIFSIMALAAKKNEEITITADGPDEEEAIKAIEAFLKENL